MNAVDGSAHVPQESYAEELEEELPSLLVIVLDVSPAGWGTESPPISLKEAVASLLVFANSHLALNHSNEIAVLAAHSSTVRFLYPPRQTTSSTDESADGNSTNNNGSQGAKGRVGGLTTEEGADPSLREGSPSSGAAGASMYRQFRVVNEAVVEQLDALLSKTSVADIAQPSNPDVAVETSMVSGALSIALSYINRQTGGGEATSGEDVTAAKRARILLVSVCSDLAAQYVPIMNCIFAAQKMKVPIDICKIGKDTVFLQQAADTTGGVYIHLDHPKGLTQYLMTAFLPDRLLRTHLVLPTQSSIDFRAACFCHKRVVDIGYVCNICLSIFCQPPADRSCAICSTVFDPLELSDLTKQPVLIRPNGQKKKAKKKAKRDEGSATPAPAPAAAAS
ncbi:TFIIH subunit Tfb4/p34 [Myxozyma melibiosi]|uniref:General transcription and DNA repair factor IIH subunit TFB4 n=1 Tax=Myxozyma melibiosi TaxID=54550 RepID=A0ABR1FCI5_9ASCO